MHMRKFALYVLCVAGVVTLRLHSGVECGMMMAVAGYGGSMVEIQGGSSNMRCATTKCGFAGVRVRSEQYDEGSGKPTEQSEDSDKGEELCGCKGIAAAAETLGQRGRMAATRRAQLDGGEGESQGGLDGVDVRGEGGAARRARPQVAGAGVQIEGLRGHRRGWVGREEGGGG